MNKCTKLNYAAWLVVKIEALLCRRSFLLWSLELKSTAGEVQGVSWFGCAALTMAAGAFYGLEEGVLQKSFLFLLLQFYIMVTGKAFTGPGLSHSSYIPYSYY